MLCILRQQRTNRHVAQNFEGLQELRFACINQNVGKEEEHPLLKSTSRVLQQAALANELAVVLHQRIESGQVTLDFAQQNKVF